MSIEKITTDFFARSSDAVARELLGRNLVRRLSSGAIVKGKISEVAAYQGNAKRTSEKIKSAPGIISVSTKYGSQLLDIATGDEGEYSCITLRAAEFEWLGKKQLVAGPGRLCKALKISKSLDGLSVYNNDIWIEGKSIDNSKIVVKKSKKMPSNCLGYYKIK